MELKRTTAREIRRQNRSALLSELFLRGPLTRLELAEITGLSPATASNVTAELIAEGVISVAGQMESDGGRPPTLLEVAHDYGYVIGVVVAETGLVVELFDVGMTKHAAVISASSSEMAADAVADRIIAGIRDVVEAAGLTPDDVIGVGVAVPGIVEHGVVEHGNQALVYAPTIGWHGVDLAKMLKAGGVTLPVFVENGAKTLAQAEMWFGVGRGARHAVMVLVGTGVGAAVVTGGTNYRGVTSSAAEWGHSTIVYGGEACRCGARGCLEAYIGSEGILQRWRRARGGRQVPGDDPIAQMRALVTSASRSTVAADVLDETADLIGAGIANLINLLNPERVVIGGWVGLEIGPQAIARIRQSAEQNALARLYLQTTIELSTLGADADALGAATQPLAALIAGTLLREPRPGAKVRGRSPRTSVA